MKVLEVKVLESSSRGFIVVCVLYLHSLLLRSRLLIYSLFLHTHDFCFCCLIHNHFNVKPCYTVSIFTTIWFLNDIGIIVTSYPFNLLGSVKAEIFFENKISWNPPWNNFENILLLNLAFLWFKILNAFSSYRHLYSILKMPNFIQFFITCITTFHVSLQYL